MSEQHLSVEPGLFMGCATRRRKMVKEPIRCSIRPCFVVLGRFLVERRLSRSRMEAEGVLEDTSRPRDEELGKLGRPERAAHE